MELDSSILYVRGLKREQKVWALVQCAEQDIRMAQYIGGLIDADKKRGERARKREQHRAMSPDNK